MGTRFSVANHAVTTHATNIEQVSGALNAQGKRFVSAVEALPASWKGQSFIAWDQLTTRWDASFKELNAALTTIRESVGQAGQLYTSGEQQQAANLEQAARGMAWDQAKFR
ncbi:Uncharacterized protein conserved in bacteria (plasmid) [Tsukamurella tyrosinosolvens]|jgi:WXG100 family type VII secretion target|uniref:ESAT-6-like protein n=2 Tax=Tsukamurella TaxID=2060 RepID=A0A5C5RL18_9ACTN|nr:MULTISPECIES: WXG100 family type VII secretion target [Tsukamurella]MCA0154796.1 WXG100 family type VII secretion target [Tsukamurella sp. M9C]MEC4615195.1 WXG100 family type VII secretion target [Tsukamurella tyrosinosolvens]TWS22901.1 WXG100 family type VII secretion target [Tsukamurella sputi]SEB65649.1 WXG100 family type VII secretion target [Tsukamurella tyrosinosolvens]VEH93252.1 Uncharacterized protein conserved in bacteria [Tsukamurella tyrosinosolvens]